MGKTFITLLCISAWIVWLAGCNTIEGMGKDVKETGQAIEKAAQKNKGGY